MIESVMNAMESNDRDGERVRGNWVCRVAGHRKPAMRSAWLGLAGIAAAVWLALGLTAPAQAAYLPSPQVGDVFGFGVDLNQDGTTDLSLSLGVTSATSGVPNATLAAFDFSSGGQLFSFPAGNATWFFDDPDMAMDGIEATITSTGCTPGMITPCSFALVFTRDYLGSYARELGDSSNNGPLQYSRLTPQSPPGQVPEPGALLLLGTAMVLAGVVRQRSRAAGQR
jgi:hypothetical protein